MESFDTSLMAFSQWLLRATLQGSLLVCLILLVKAALRERLPARWHYCLWLLLLVRLALPWAPQSRLSIYNLIPDRLSPWGVTSGSAGLFMDAARTEPDRSDRGGGSSGAPAAEGAEGSQQGRSGTAEPAAGSPSSATVVLYRQQAPPSGGQGHLSASVVLRGLTRVWLLGGAILATYILIKAFRLWRGVTAERPVTDQEILDLLEDCKLQMRVRTLVGVVVTDKVQTPALFGFLRPRILLPQGLVETLGLDELHHVFLHELAHLKRRDIYVAWLICLLQVLHWFNPLIWLAFQRMRADQEMAADSLALAAAGAGASHRYGQTIVRLLERFSRPQYLPSLAGILESPSRIERRIQMIAHFKSSSRPWSALGIGVVAVLATIAVVDPVRGTGATSPTRQAQAPLAMRLVEKQTLEHESISPDGKYLCESDPYWEGIITIREFATDVQRTILPTKRTPEEGGPEYPVMSPDNKTVAYLVQHRGRGRADLCLIGADGGGQRVLYPGVIRSIKEASAAEAPVAYPGVLRPIQWFPDGSRVLGLRWPDPMHTFREIQIVSISAGDGSAQVIKTLAGEFFRTAVRLSPDARYVAFELTSKETPTKHDVFAIEIESRRETALVGHPADDRLLDWTPDGRHILFTSDRLGPRSVWLLPVAQGQAQGTPELVAPNMGDVAPVGFTGNGSFYYRLAYNFASVYTAALDLTTGQVLSAPVPLEAAGLNLPADWSPDGKYLAYCSQPDAGREPRVIRIRSLATGEERELRHKLPWIRQLRWSPDGHSLLVSWLTATKPEEVPWTRRVCRLDVETGEDTILLEKENSQVWSAELSPDGKTLYYSARAIVRRQLDTGEEKDILTLVQNAPGAGWALSPSGEFIAAGRNAGSKKSQWEGGIKTLLLVPAQGGPVAELLRWEEPVGFLTGVTWSTDGKSVLLILHKESATGGKVQFTNEFWQVPVTGGQPRKIMTEDGMCGGLRVHPDGRSIVFSQGGRNQELWVMENFLPAETDAGDRVP